MNSNTIIPSDHRVRCPKDNMEIKEFPFHRIAILGTTGSGKTTLAKVLGGLLEIPVISLDNLKKDGDGNTIDTESFLHRLESIVSDNSWIIDGGYKVTHSTILKNAQAAIWLDYPLGIILSRRAKRNFEQRPLFYSTYPSVFARRFINLSHVMKNTVWKHYQLRKTYPHLFRDFPHLHLFHFTHPNQMQKWLKNLHLNQLQ